jgi:hypothetical protein
VLDELFGEPNVIACHVDRKDEVVGPVDAQLFHCSSLARRLTALRVGPAIADLGDMSEAAVSGPFGEKSGYDSSSRRSVTLAVVALVVTGVVGAAALVAPRGVARGRNQFGAIQTEAPATRTASPTAQYRPALDAAGDPLYVSPRRQLPAPNGAESLPAALTATVSSGPVITPSGARDAVRAAWTLHARALERLDIKLMSAFETGAALELDAGRCDCGPGNPFGDIKDMAVSVPRQTAYPAQFFAQVATTASNQPWVAFLVFSRTEAASPWRLAFIGGFQASDASVTPPAVGADGYLAPQTASPLFDPAAAHRLLADYWRTAKRTATVAPSSNFAPGIWTNQFATKLTQYHQGGIGQNGLVGYYAYETDPANDPAYTFAEGQGWQIVCSALRVQKTFVAPPGRSGPYQDKAGQNLGPLVPPGVHNAVIVTEITVPCIEVPPAGSSAKATVLGADEYTDWTDYIDLAPVRTGG